MSLNVIKKQPSKYEVVKILGIESDPSKNHLRVFKLVKLKKPSRVTMPAFINLVDDEIIEIDDNDKENESSAANQVNVGELIQNNTKNGSNLIISAVTSSCQPVKKPVPAVISITTDEINNTNIHEEIQKVKKSLDEKSTSFENSGHSQSQMQPKSLSNTTESEELLVELMSSQQIVRNAQQSVQMEVDSQTKNPVLKEVEQVNQNRPKRARKVPQKLMGVENYKPLVMKFRISDTQDSTKPSNKRKSYEIVGPEKPQKIQRRSEKLSNLSDFGMKFTQDGSILRSSPVKAVEVQKSIIRQQEDKISQNLVNEAESFVEIPTKNTEISQKPTRKSSEIDAVHNTPKIQPTSTTQPKDSIQVNESKWMTLNEIGPIYLTSTRDPQEVFKGLNSTKATIHQGGVELKKIDASKYEFDIKSDLKPKLQQSSPENPEFQNFISTLNLQPATSSSTIQKSTIQAKFPLTPPETSSPKGPGSYLMNLKCHKTCSSGKAHKKKHQVDISSQIGQLLIRRDAVGESDVQESLRRIEELTKTPLYDSQYGRFIHSKSSAKQERKLKPKVGRKPEESEVLSLMREFGLERNFFRPGRDSVLKREEFSNVKDEWMLRDIKEEEV